MPYDIMRNHKKISNIQKKNLSNTTTKKNQLTKYIFKIDKRSYEFICIRSEQRSKDDWNHFILTGHLEASRCLCLLPMPRRVDTQKCHVLQISCYVLISLCITPREYETCWYWQAPTTETGCALTLRRLTPLSPFLLLPPSDPHSANELTEQIVMVFLIIFSDRNICGGVSFSAIHFALIWCYMQFYFSFIIDSILYTYAVHIHMYWYTYTVYRIYNIHVIFIRHTKKIIQVK